MTIAAALLAEFEQEALTTRKFLERLPEDKLLWKPHEKSALREMKCACNSSDYPMRANLARWSA